MPEVQQSFAFMYSIEDPAGQAPSFFDLGDKNRFSAVGAQILGPDDEYICQHETDISRFWASEFRTKLFILQALDSCEV
jgi:tocopherol cyclase